jgi:hypothetical protein
MLLPSLLLVGWLIDTGLVILPLKVGLELRVLVIRLLSLQLAKATVHTALPSSTLNCLYFSIDLKVTT